MSLADHDLGEGPSVILYITKNLIIYFCMVTRLQGMSSINFDCMVCIFGNSSSSNVKDI